VDPERFGQSTAGQVIRVGQGEAAYWAFVPHPLPPRLTADWELTGVLSEADRARRLQDLREEWHRRLAQARTSALLLRLADALFESPILTIPQAQQRLGVTYPSAQRNVAKLVGAGILQPVGQVAYGKTYRAAEIMRVIGEETTP